MEIGIQESEIISSKAEHTGHRPGEASERNAGRARLIHLSVYYISHSLMHSFNALKYDCDYSVSLAI